MPENATLATIAKDAARMLNESAVPKAETWGKRTIVEHLITQITALWEAAAPDLSAGSSHEDLALASTS
jgi:hypothetical protein